MPTWKTFASHCLAGIVVNDSILLMLFLKSQLAEGIDVETAAREAARVRFRAVMMTSLTTIVGLLPLLFERSLQAQVLIPIAISICFGLLASTLLVSGPSTALRDPRRLWNDSVGAFPAGSFRQ